jgi:hypothetical protein
VLTSLNKQIKQDWNNSEDEDGQTDGTLILMERNGK